MTRKEFKEKMNTVLGVQVICNVAAMMIHEYDFVDDRVLVSINKTNVRWCPIVYDVDFGNGFLYNGDFYSFDEFMKV